MDNNKYYAIKEGKNGVRNKVVKTWRTCRKHVYMYPPARYKSFNSLEECQEYFDLEELYPTEKQVEYIDDLIDTFKRAKKANIKKIVAFFILLKGE